MVNIEWNDGVINDEIIEKSVKKLIKPENSEVKGIPNDYNFNNTTVIYYDDKGIPMFGQYLEHGLKEGKIRYKMFKKNKLGFRTGYWTLDCKDVNIVEQDGILINPDKYIKTEEGFYKKI